jgi:hypothetical protein
MSGVTPKEVYEELLNAGASTTQAIGLMANMINESSLNPEAVEQGVADPGYGLIQWENSSYPGASGLVTGNPQADLKAQVRYAAQTGAFRAASGSTGAEAAGNFAANYERCEFCAPGQSQYNSRVANAATVAGWIAGNKWPTKASGTAGQGGGSTTGTLTAATPGCLFSMPSVSIGPVNAGGACLFEKSAARGAVGGLVLAGGLLTLAVGAILLAAYGLKNTGAGKVVASAAQAVPGATGVAARVASRKRPPVAAKMPKAVQGRAAAGGTGQRTYSTGPATSGGNNFPKASTGKAAAAKGARRKGP